MVQRVELLGRVFCVFSCCPPAVPGRPLQVSTRMPPPCIFPLGTHPTFSLLLVPVPVLALGFLFGWGPRLAPTTLITNSPAPFLALLPISFPSSILQRADHIPFFLVQPSFQSLRHRYYQPGVDLSQLQSHLFLLSTTQISASILRYRRRFLFLPFRELAGFATIDFLCYHSLLRLSSTRFESLKLAICSTPPPVSYTLSIHLFSSCTLDISLRRL